MARQLCPQCEKKRDACKSKHCRRKPHCWICGNTLEDEGKLDE